MRHLGLFLSTFNNNHTQSRAVISKNNIIYFRAAFRFLFELSRQKFQHLSAFATHGKIYITAIFLRF